MLLIDFDKLFIMLYFAFPVLKYKRHHPDYENEEDDVNEKYKYDQFSFPHIKLTANKVYIR